MNTRLSIPSTISIALKVMRVIHVCGSEINSSIASLPVFSANAPTRAAFAEIDQKRTSQITVAEDQAPDQQHIHHQHEHGSRAHVLGAAGQFVDLGAVALDHRFDR